MNTMAWLENNSSPEDINSSDLFKRVSHVLETLEITDITQTQKIEESWVKTQLASFDINELRLLKQALNNQICLSVFQKFLDIVSTLREHELLCPTAEWEIDTISCDDYMNWDSKKFKNIRTPKRLFFSRWEATKWALFSELQKQPQLLFINNPVTKKLFPWIQKNLKTFYVWFYVRILAWVFDALLEKYVTAHRNSPAIITYLCLENYVEQYTSESEGVLFSSRTHQIFPNMSSDFILKAIELWFSSDKIQHWLAKHYKEDIKSALWDFQVPWAPKLIQENDLWGCPFAKSKINWENAFHHMFQTLDAYLLTLLQALEKKLD